MLKMSEERQKSKLAVALKESRDTFKMTREQSLREKHSDSEFWKDFSDGRFKTTVRGFSLTNISYEELDEILSKYKK